MRAHRTTQTISVWFVYVACHLSLRSAYIALPIPILATSPKMVHSRTQQSASLRQSRPVSRCTGRPSPKGCPARCCAAAAPPPAHTRSNLSGQRRPLAMPECALLVSNSRHSISGMHLTSTGKCQLAKENRRPSMLKWVVHADKDGTPLFPSLGSCAFSL